MSSIFIIFELNKWAPLLSNILLIVILGYTYFSIRQYSSTTQHQAPPLQEQSNIILKETSQPVNEVQIKPILEGYTNKLHSIAELAERVEQGSLMQADNVAKSTTAMENISVAILQIATNSQTVSSTSQEANDTATEGAKSVTIIEDQMAAINSSVDHISIAINELAMYSTDIGKIVQSITDISNQTNLLALNAAIEAARAGEHGKGFAIVADEVRKLSEEVKNSSNQIAEIVTSIQQNVNKSVSYMTEGKSQVTTGISVVDNVKDTFNHIQLKIHDVSQQIIEVSAAVQELSAGSEEITQNVELTKKIQEDGVNMIKQLNNQINEELKDLQQQTKYN